LVTAINPETPGKVRKSEFKGESMESRVGILEVAIGDLEKVLL
jgi:hypothetical protein